MYDHNTSVTQSSKYIKSKMQSTISSHEEIKVQNSVPIMPAAISRKVCWSCVCFVFFLARLVELVFLLWAILEPL